MDDGKLLDRELSRAATEAVRRIGGPVLREVVDYGIAVFVRCAATATDLDVPMGILFPFLHCLEMLDATEVLLDAAVVAPTHAILRSAFEADLYCEYVAMDDSQRRGAAYVVAEVHRRLGALDRLDPATEKGKQFASGIMKDRVGAEIQVPPIPNLAQSRQSLKAVLTKPHLSDAAREYDRVTTHSGRTPPFHCLWGGPSNIEQLAAKLGRSGEYELLYRHWSLTTHGLGLSRQLGVLDGEPAVARFRNGDGLTTAYSQAISFGVGAIHRLLKKYRPGELAPAFQDWYMEKIRPDFAKLSPDLAQSR